jgi:hypothetical protein
LQAFRLRLAPSAPDYGGTSPETGEGNLQMR